MSSSYFEYIRFPRDGIAAKLTSSGLTLGTSSAGALTLANIIKDVHTKRLKRRSPIEPAPLADEIRKHAVAYVVCGNSLSAGVLVGVLVCGKIKRHANPVNVEWHEVMDTKQHSTQGLGLD